MFEEIRRQDRILDDQNRIAELLNISEYVFLNLNNDAYGLPLHYVYEEGMNMLYCSYDLEWQNLDMIKSNNKLSCCVIGKTQIVDNEFTTLCESVLVFGQATLIDDDERLRALRLIAKKHSPNHEELGETYVEKWWTGTGVLKIEIEHITAKAKYQ